MTEQRIPNPVMELCGASPVTCLEFNRHYHQPYLLSGHQNGKILLWNLKTQRVVSTNHSHTESVLCIYCPVTAITITHGREGIVKIWKCLEPFKWDLLGQVPTTAFIFCNSTLLECSDYQLLATPTDTSCVTVHHFPKMFTLENDSPDMFCSAIKSSPCSCNSQLTPTCKKKFGMCMRMSSVCLRDSAARLIVAYESGCIGLWDLGSKTLLNKIDAFSDTIMSLDTCWSKGVVRVLAGSVNTELKSWIISDDSLCIDQSASLTNEGIGSITTRSDGRIVATGGWDGLCRLFTVAKLRPLAVLSNHKESIQCVAFSPDKKFAVGSKDGYVTLWDVYADR